MFKNLDPANVGVHGSQSEIIESTLSNGFKGLDLDITEFAESVKTHGLPKARRYLDSARLKIGSYRLPLSWTEDEALYRADLEKLPAALELAKQIDCPRVVTTIEPANDVRPYHENFELHRRRLSEIAGVLARYNARLGLEFLAPLELRKGRAFQFLQTADAVLMLLKNIGAPNVGLALDVWHWHLGGGTLDQLEALGGAKIVTLSLADAEPDATAATADDSQRRLPGETGVIEIAGLLTFLAKSKYDGPVTPRPSRTQFAGQGRDKIVKQLGASLDQLWKAAGINPAGKLSPLAGV